MNSQTHENQDHQCLPNYGSKDGQHKLQGDYDVTTTPDGHTSDSTTFLLPCVPLPNYPVNVGWTRLADNDDLSVTVPLAFDFSLYGSLYQAGQDLIYVSKQQ